MRVFLSYNALDARKAEALKAAIEEKEPEIAVSSLIKVNVTEPIGSRSSRKLLPKLTLLLFLLASPLGNGNCRSITRHTIGS